MVNKRDAVTDRVVNSEACQLEIRQGIGNFERQEIQETDEFTMKVEGENLESKSVERKS